MGRFTWPGRRSRRFNWAFLSLGLVSAACFIPEYTIDGGVTDQSGGAPSSSGGGAPSTGAASSSGATTGNGGNSAGGTGGGGTGGSDTGGQGGEGGAPPAWSCADEESDLPSYYSNGTLCGYRYAARFPTSGSSAPEVNPPCLASNGSDCFRTAYPFVTGNVPPSADPVYPNIIIGMAANQASVGGFESSWELEGFGIAVDYTANGATVPIRIQLMSGADIYCAHAMPNEPLAWEDFRSECWNPASTGTLQAGDTIDELHILVTSTDTQQYISQLDINSITMLPDEPELACDGCAMLFVPFGAAPVAGAYTDYNLDLGMAYDLGDSGIRLRARVLVETAGTTGGLQIVLRSSVPGDPKAYFWHDSALMEGWHDLVIAPAQGETANGFDAGQIDAIGFNLTTGTPPAGAVTADATVYVDSITFTGDVPAGLEDILFDADLEGLTQDMSTDVDGSTLTWVTTECPEQQPLDGDPCGLLAGMCDFSGGDTCICSGQWEWACF